MPFDQTVVFNGDVFKSYRPHNLNLALAPVETSGTELQIYNGRPRVVVLGLEHNPVLYACGIIHTELNHNPADLRPALDSRKFRLESQVVSGDRTCHILRSVPDPARRFYEYWVDSTDYRKIYQVHGFGLGGEGRLWVTTKIEYRDSEHGPLPSTWEIQRFENSTNKAAVYRMQLDEFDVSPAFSDEDFDIDPPPGTRVSDDNLPRDARKYVVAVPNQPDLPVGEFEAQQEQRESRLSLFVGLAMIVLLSVGAIATWRRRHAG
ncbi:MAG: hypothetical protein RIK87_08595 [Fuerstiella sp.]